ncbi:MAG: T9SS type A sorting domain-containing protein [Candidatus Neomarinimicrobiota bacterium]
MMKKLLNFLLIGVLLLTSGFAREKPGSTPEPLTKVSVAESPISTVMTINNITLWVRGDGWHEAIVDGSWNGTFPKGKAGLIFSEGMVWGGFVRDGVTPELRVGGSEHGSGNVAGRVLSKGEAVDPDDPDVRPYRVRPDFQTADLTDDAANFYLVPVDEVTGANTEEIHDWYEIDWLNWPWEWGAPYVDRDGNGEYEPDPDGDGIYGELEVDDGDTTYVEDIPGVEGADQTMWIVYNDLDAGRVVGLHGSIPTGLEVQETYWAYALDNPLGNAIFKRVRLIYKGTENTPDDAVIEDMYISQWSDPDLGQYTDDYSGCDTTLSLGYVYNSTNSDAVWDAWGIASPAGGYDFLQGPLLEGIAGEDRNKNGVDDSEDYAIFDLKPVGPGFINLPMTAFVPFIAGSPRTDPTLNAYEGTLQWYNLMRACEPRPGYPACDPILDERGNPTNFELSGDPVLGSGDLDGQPTPWNQRRYPPGDRRITMSSGPFNMAFGDTQEVVVALVGGSGENYLQSVAIMKFNDTFVQEAYDNLFDLPSGPPAPDLRIIAQDQELVLEWESNTEAVAATENSDIKGYLFEGYNVYQLPGAAASKSEAVLLATYDLETSPGYIFQDVFDPDVGVAVNKPVQFGVNSGISWYLRITKDAFTGERLINGKTYYFSVTAYNQNMSLDVSTHALESPHTQSLRAGIPHSPDPQTIYPHSLGDTLEVVDVEGFDDAPVISVLSDPEAPDGEEFEVRFTVNETADTTWWELVRVDVTPETTLVSLSTNLDGVTEYRYLHLGGFVLTVGDVSGGIKSVTEEGNNVVGSNPGGDYYLSGSASDMVAKAIDENDYEIRFTSSGSFALTGPTLPTTDFVQVPFEVWDLGAPDDDSDDMQLFGYFDDAADDGEWNTEGNDPIGGESVFDKIHIAKVGYTSTTDTVSGQDKAKIFFSLDFRPIDKIYVVGSQPQEGTNILLSTYKQIKDGDIKRFSVGTVDRDDEGDTPKERVKRVTVFPNPYLGINTWEISRFQKYVTFSHLPKVVTVKIFTLAGVLVRTLTEEDKSNPDSQFLRWDLTNENDLPVASGIYILHVDMPDIGEETVLKLALVQEQQYLRSY